MTTITTVEQLEALYGEPSEASLVKEVNRIIPEYGAFIAASPFVALATVGPEGLDCSPRGDLAEVVRIADEKTVMLPDRRGNNRTDSLKNIIRDGRVALLFLVPGSPPRCASARFADARRLCATRTGQEERARSIIATPRCRSGHCRSAFALRASARLFAPRRTGSGARFRAFASMFTWRENRARPVFLP